MSYVNNNTLGKENFDTWKIQIQAILIKNDLWDYINESVQHPDTEKEPAIWDIRVNLSYK